ncbi:MAG TPA: RHS repeat-associated core domain-containing protein [Flavobacterium sp.]|jgi:RHS repeat-associated protein
MAIYNKTSNNGRSAPIIQKELPIFGLSRLGVYNKEDNSSSYQIADHLGNVWAVIKKINGNPVIESYADYYPFGEQLPERNSTSSYRYAFQGQEKDPETGMEAFQLRLWDGRIGRWLSPDPYGQYASLYLGMGNNPVGMIDPDGGSTKPPNEYDVNGNLISTLGGNSIDYIHQKDGSILIQNCSTGESITTKAGMDILKGFVNRDKNIDYMDIFNEFKDGYGPKRSLFDGNHPMTIDMKESQAAYVGRSMYMSNGGKKGYVGFDFGITGIFSAGPNMTEQMVGSVGVSIYPVGNKVVFILTDTKTPRSLFYHLPGIKSKFNRDDGNPRGRLMPYSETKQTYIWTESVKVLKQKYHRCEEAQTSRIIMP